MPRACAPQAQPFAAEAFEPSTDTVLRWLDLARFLINCRGTMIMIDTLLQGFDMPTLVEFPIAADTVPRVDAVTVTHSDNNTTACRPVELWPGSPPLAAGEAVHRRYREWSADDRTMAGWSRALAAAETLQPVLVTREPGGGGA